jgi:hypothetical protein
MRQMHGSWLDWDRGSALFFWRWPREYQEEIRDGVEFRFSGPPPSTMKRGSVEPPRVPIRSLMSTLSVAKGDDTRMVFDALKSKLNEVLFVPWFALATAEALFRTVNV